MSCGLALFSVFNKGLLECHHLQKKKKRKEKKDFWVTLCWWVLSSRVPRSTTEQDVSAIPSEADVEKLNFRCPSVDAEQSYSS